MVLSSSKRLLLLLLLLLLLPPSLPLPLPLLLPDADTQTTLASILLSTSTCTIPSLLLLSFQWSSKLQGKQTDKRQKILFQKKVLNKRSACHCTHISPHQRILKPKFFLFQGYIPWFLMRNVSVYVTGAQLATDLKQWCLQFKKRKPTSCKVPCQVPPFTNLGSVVNLDSFLQIVEPRTLGSLVDVLQA